MACHSDDLETALAMVEVCLDHSQLLYTNLPDAANKVKFRLTGKKQHFLDSLPDQFQRKEADHVWADPQLNQFLMLGITINSPPILTRIE